MILAVGLNLMVQYHSQYSHRYHLIGRLQYKCVQERLLLSQLKVGFKSMIFIHIYVLCVRPSVINRSLRCAVLAACILYDNFVPLFLMEHTTYILILLFAVPISLQLMVTMTRWSKM